MLRYFGHYRKQKNEITYDEALHTVTAFWGNEELAKGMLSIVNNIQVSDRYWHYITVEDIGEGGYHRVLMAGMWNMLPDGMEYREEEDGSVYYGKSKS